MKIIHCADVHLGSKLDSLPKELAEKRKAEIRNTFLRMVQFAREEGISVILLAGDIFDREKPYKKDVEFFYDVIQDNAEIDFIYLRGNHDGQGERREFSNLKTFTNEWRYYEYGNIVIGGIELNRENCRSYYSTLKLDGSRTNLVMLHGQIGDEINLSKLREKNIDYLALGHVHKFESGLLDKRGTYAYSGCLEGRGFDETGEKGFILLEIDDSIEVKFQPFAHRKIEFSAVDVTGLESGYAMAKRVKDECALSKDTIYRIELIGEVDAGIDEFERDVFANLERECLFLSLKDKTKKLIDYQEYEGDISLKGEFVRTVRESEEYTEEEKIQIIAYGLKALEKREVDE